jgi:hypothetical protein
MVVMMAVMVAMTTPVMMVVHWVSQSGQRTVLMMAMH